MQNARVEDHHLAILPILALVAHPQPALVGRHVYAEMRRKDEVAHVCIMEGWVELGGLGGLGRWGVMLYVHVRVRVYARECMVGSR